jgi:hypothetical protein
LETFKLGMPSLDFGKDPLVGEEIIHRLVVGFVNGRLGTHYY